MSSSLKISERAQVVLILFLAFVALLLAWYFLLWPQFQQRSENRKLRQDLATSPFAKHSISALNAAAANEQKFAKALDEDWEATALRLTTLADYPLLRRADPARIDFQVELAAGRSRLAAKSENMRIKLPPDLGIDSAVTSQEVVRERLIQLKTVEKLVDLVIDQRIRNIASIRILPPLLHYGTDQKLICEEYPVEVDFSTPFDALFHLFSNIFDKDCVFVFSKIRVTSDPKIDEVLHIKAVMSSLIFQ